MINSILALCRPAIRQGVFAAICLPLVTASNAFAQEPGGREALEADLETLTAIEDRLNAAGICAPLQFDLRTVSALVGLPVPAFVPIDTHLRWDQSRHQVERFASTPTQVVLEFRLGCQPSTNGAALDYLGLSPDKVRLDDKVNCTGTRSDDGELDTLDCTVDGKVGALLAKTIIDLSEKVGRLLPMQLAVPVATPAAPTGPSESSNAISGGAAETVLEPQSAADPSRDD